jgi:hypothetical protein
MAIVRRVSLDAQIVVAIWGLLGLVVCNLFAWMSIPVGAGFETEIMALGNAGGLSDHVAVPAKHAIPLPEGFPLDLGGEYHQSIS